MRDPCPYCRLPRMTRSYVDPWSRGELRDIKDHACSAWAPKPALSIFDTDTTFIRDGRNSQEGLALYREYLARQR